MGSCHGQIRRSGHRTDARRVAIYVVTCRNLQEELTLRATTLTGVGRLYLSHISSSTPAVSSSDDFHSAFWTLLAKVGLSGLISDSVPTIRPSPFGSCAKGGSSRNDDLLMRAVSCGCCLYHFGCLFFFF